MPLTQLIYVSQRTSQLSPDLLASIVCDSSVKNKRRNVTGVLMCFGHDLLQLLEGESADVGALFDRIKSDPRHANVQCLVRKSVQKRLFPNWGMGLADLESKAMLDRDRLIRMLDDLRAHSAANAYSVEARVAISDFKQQLAMAISSDLKAG